MATATFRKNSKTNEWQLFGPANVVLAGDFCQASRADGTTRRIFVASVSRSFLVNGIPYVYGVIGTAAPKPAPKPVEADTYYDNLYDMECEAEAEAGVF